MGALAESSLLPVQVAAAELLAPELAESWLTPQADSASGVSAKAPITAIARKVKFFFMLCLFMGFMDFNRIEWSDVRLRCGQTVEQVTECAAWKAIGSLAQSAIPV